MPTNTCTDVDPEYIRVEEVKARFGFSRSFAYDLMSAGLIKSKVLRRPGNIRGARLLSVESIRSYIEAQPES